MIAVFSMYNAIFTMTQNKADKNGMPTLQFVTLCSASFLDPLQ
jgi:hypothetical protein